MIIIYKLEELNNMGLTLKFIKMIKWEYLENLLNRKWNKTNRIASKFKKKIH